MYHLLLTKNHFLVILLLEDMTWPMGFSKGPVYSKDPHTPEHYLTKNLFMNITRLS